MARAELTATVNAAKPSHCFFLSAMGSGSSLSTTIGLPVPVAAAPVGWALSLTADIVRPRHAVVRRRAFEETLSEFNPADLSIVRCVWGIGASTMQ